MGRHQRERVAAAVAGILAEEGYAAVSVERLRRRAGISRSTFYVHFANKEEAVIASYDLYFHRFCADVEARCDGRPDQSERIRAAISQAFKLAADEPATAQLLFGSSLCAAPALARHVMETQGRLLAAVCADGGNPPSVLAQAVLGVVTQLLSRRLIDGDVGSLPQLEADLIELQLKLEEHGSEVSADGDQLR